MCANKAVWAVVPAAGRGRRMHADRPKQYLEFQGKTILEHCLDRLLANTEIDGVVLVLDDADRFWDQLNYNPGKPLFVTSGGRERQHSVYHGLATLQNRCGSDLMALVHDAARPLITEPDLRNVIDAARKHAVGAILGAPVTDTLKLQNDRMEVQSTQSRDKLWRALTPQVFHLQMLLNALEQVIDEGKTVTDEAQALERVGLAPALVAGAPTNIKITNRQDLRLAEIIWLHQRDQ